jgi:hypothetical protein
MCHDGRPVGTALILVGFAVQAVGVVIAAAGLQQTKAELFPGRPLPPGRWWRWLRARPPVRWVFGPPEVRAHALTAMVSVTSHAVGRLKVTRAQPADDADESAWRVYLMTRLDDLDSEIDDAQQRAGEDRAAAEAAATALRDELHAVEGRLTSRMNEAVGGPEGSGIDKQFWGLTLALVGGAVAVVGGLM